MTMLAPAAAPAASGGELAWRPDRTLVRLSPWSGEVIALARANGADELCMLSAGGRLTRVAETGPWRLKQLWWVAPRVELWASCSLVWVSWGQGTVPEWEPGVTLGITGRLPGR